MNTIEKVRAELERRLKEPEQGYETGEAEHAYKDALKEFLSFLGTLEVSERPEPYNPIYDEEYLNKKIAKATESWKGVGVDAMLAECRGYDKGCLADARKTLDEAADKYVSTLADRADENLRIDTTLQTAFKAGAKWMENQFKKVALSDNVYIRKS